jgi:hypothetical protein
LINYHYPRPDLAKSLAGLFSYKNQFSLGRDGVFLAGERRIGKTSFLIRDLKPLLEQQGWVVVYLDLMENKQVDPGAQIIASIRDAINAQDNAISNTLKKIAPAGLNLSVLGVGGGINLHKTT